MIYLYLASFLGSCAFLFAATWHGACLCKEEARKAGELDQWGTAPVFGMKPQNWRVYALAGFGTAVFVTLRLLGHPLIAGEFAKDAALVVGGIAGATWWAGCC